MRISDFCRFYSFQNFSVTNCSFFWISRNFSDFSSFGKNIFFEYKYKKFVLNSRILIAQWYRLSPRRERSGDRNPPKSHIINHKFDLWDFDRVLLRLTRTYTTYITFFDVKNEHSNLQGPFCELLSHTTSLYLTIFVTGSYCK
jgi:hypothetical protein